MLHSIVPFEELPYLRREGSILAADVLPFRIGGAVGGQGVDDADEDDVRVAAEFEGGHVFVAAVVDVAGARGAGEGCVGVAQGGGPAVQTDVEIGRAHV